PAALRRRSVRSIYGLVLKALHCSPRRHAKPYMAERKPSVRRDGGIFVPGVLSRASTCHAARAPDVLRVKTQQRTAGMSTVANIDVLIVGAGPVGLFLANECARRGLRWRLVEARASQSEYSKALAIFPRTLEIFDMAGVVAPFLKAANRVTQVAMIAHGRRLARMQFTPEESPYSFVAMIPQDVTEKLLVEELRRKGGAVEYETAFVSAVQRND